MEQPLLLHRAWETLSDQTNHRGGRSSIAVSWKYPFCSPGKEHPAPSAPQVSPRCIKTSACFPAGAVRSELKVLLIPAK